jgi:hypothetical protein
MKSRASFLRRLVPLLVALGAIVGLVLSVGSAGASPAISPPIEAQVPADGAPVAATEEAIKVTFSCPEFVFEEGEVIEEEVEEPEEEPEGGEEGEPEAEEAEVIPVPPVVLREPSTNGGAEEYGVHFSTSATTNAAGQLGTSGFGEAGEGESEAIKGSRALCNSELELPTKPEPAALYEGKVYWQPYRESAVAADGIEAGPVHSFTVYPYVELPELIFREQVFAGYLTKVSLDYESELGGAVVQLQEFEGSAWKTIAEAPGNNKGENFFFFKPKQAGHHLFRALVIGGGPGLGLEPETKAIRKPTKVRVTSAADDGAYLAANAKEREESPITFGVKGDGSSLWNLSAEAEVTCKGPDKYQDVKIEVGAVLKHAKIAPDGTVFGVSKTQGPEEWTVTLTGSIFQGRFQGELSTTHANCTGYRVIDAILKSSIKS